MRVGVEALLCAWLMTFGGLGTLQAQEHHAGGAPEGRPAAGGARPAAGPRLGPGGSAPGRSAFDGRGQVLDSHYNHGRYYPPMGSVRPSLPGEYRPYFRGRDRFYFSGGVWYAPRGPGFVVVRPPAGLVINVLPPYYSTVWLAGNPYYYADNVYYSWQPDQNGYAVVDPPPDESDQPSAPPLTRRRRTISSFIQKMAKARISRPRISMNAIVGRGARPASIRRRRRPVEQEGQIWTVCVAITIVRCLLAYKAAAIKLID